MAERNSKQNRGVGILLLFIAAAMILLFIWPAQAAEKARLMERWLVNDPLSTRAVDHTLWAEILQSYVVPAPDGRYGFDYGEVTAEDRQKLDQYINLLERTDIDRLNREEQLAYWVNAFNALAVRFVLDEYPVKSINDFGGGLFSSGPWDKRVFRVYSINLSLNDIYHRILRPIWQDPRVHYVVSCAAKGCADLVAYPYTGPAIDRTLEVAAGNFINQGPGILDIRDGTLRVSSIYKWYRDDFGTSEDAVLKYLKSMAADEMALHLEDVNRISNYGFDWALNVAPQ